MAAIVNRNDIILQATSPRVDDIAAAIVDYSDLTDNLGIQPDDNADVTLVNTAANVTDQTGFATLAKINSGNVGTYIDNLAIKNAQMATAAIGTANIITANVTTLTIAGQAVTVPQTTTAGQVSMGQGSSVTGLSTSFTSSGIGVTVFICSMNAPLRWNVIGSAMHLTQTPVTMRLYIDGSLKSTLTLCLQSTTLGYSISLSSGSHTVLIKYTSADLGGSTTQYVTSTHLFIQEAKR